jgi:hypothetical protein
MFLLSKHHIPTSGIVYGVGKCHIATSKVIFGVVNDTFHWVAIEEGAYKVELHSVMFLKTTLIFSNSKNNLAQLLLKDVKGQVYSHSRKV